MQSFLISSPFPWRFSMYKYYLPIWYTNIMYENHEEILCIKIMYKYVLISRTNIMYKYHGPIRTNIMYKYYIQKMCTIPLAKLVECSPMAPETGVQSQVESYQRLNVSLMSPCLIPSIIRYGSMIKWINPGKGVVPSCTPRLSSY